MPDLYFNRVPSLPATDDGSARPLTEDLSSGSGDGEDITWDADFAGRHHFKSGYQFTRLGSDVLMGDQQNNITLFWGAVGLNFLYIAVGLGIYLLAFRSARETTGRCPQ